MTNSRSLCAFASLPLVLTLAAGCSKKPTMDIPPYPNSMATASAPAVDSDAGTLYRLRRQTPDGVRSVAAFYREELVVKRGWTEQQGIGPTFSDGNLNVVWNGGGPGEAIPVDPTRSGGQVTIVEDSDRTFIVMWQHVPKT